jgi:dTDP-glucose 4,6-dehydratase
MKNSERIIVTGGLGFIGSNYLNKYVLAHKDYLFINVDCVTYAANPKNILVLKAKNYAFEKIDIRDTEKLERVFKKYKPTSIIHFAAESHVDNSIEKPSVFVETNIIGTHNLLVLARKYNIKRFLQISTDEVYGSLSKNVPAFTTLSNLVPNSPYSASKASADLLVMAYHATFGLNTIITRCSNNYGPNQDTTKFIPKFITLLLRNKRVPLYSKGENVRDWIYVEDHIDAIDTAFQKGRSGGIYNIGGNCELSNIEMVRKLLKLTGKKEGLVEFVADRKGHDFRYAIDTNEIEKELGWKAKINLETGLAKTLEYYTGNTKFN